MPKREDVKKVLAQFEKSVKRQKKVNEEAQKLRKEE